MSKVLQSTITLCSLLTVLLVGAGWAGAQGRKVHQSNPYRSQPLEAKVPLAKQLGGYRRLMDVTRETIAYATDAAGGAQKTFVRGRDLFVVFSKQVMDPRGRLVYVAENTHEMETPQGGSSKLTGLIYFSYGHDGSRRIHGIRGANANQVVWMDDTPEGYVTDVPREITLGSRLKLVEAGGRELSVTGREQIYISDLGEFEAFRLEGSTTVQLPVYGGIMSVKSNIVAWLAPDVGLIKLVNHMKGNKGPMIVEQVQEMVAREITK